MKPKDSAAGLGGLIYNHRFLLMLVVATAIVIRSIPGWLNWGYGSDYGIYYGITMKLAQTPKLYQPYSGWGSSYEYFPMLYLITLGFHWLTGASIDFLLPKVAPIFGGLTVLILYFIALELFKSRKLALLSAALLAVSTVQLYQTSHAAPLTMGHFFLLLSIYFFIKYRNNESYAGPLYVSTMFLAASHHLSTYIYLISISAVIIYRNWKARDWTPKIKADVFYLMFASGFSFLYWFLIATPVFNAFMRSGTGVSPLALVAAFYALFFASLALCRLRMKRKRKSAAGNPEHPETVKGARQNAGAVQSARRAQKAAQIPTTSMNVAKLIISTGVIWTIALVFYLINFRGVLSMMGWLSILVILPIMSAVISFGIVGWPYLRLYSGGAFLKGWMLVIILSGLYGFFTGNAIIIPERHIEYLMEPACILGAIGIMSFASRFPYKIKKIVGMLVVGLIAANAVAYPIYMPHSSFQEGIPDSSYNAIEWLRGSAQNNSTIATDHRLGAVIELDGQSGLHATFEQARNLWNCTSIGQMLENMTYNESVSVGGSTANVTRRVSYFLIDSVIYRCGLNVGLCGNNEFVFPRINGTTYPILQSNPQEFHLVYRNCTYKGYNETALGAIYNLSVGNI
ncbi:MAG: hypothetical protein CVT47_00385, partial [Thermoplasmata archaeon HGW-Thermoplasmata-2]